MTLSNTSGRPYDWDEIDRWREEGLSYREIMIKHKKLTGYAPGKSSLSYHYGAGQKEKTLERSRKRRARGGPFLKMIEDFGTKKYVVPIEPMERRGRYFYMMVRTFLGKEKISMSKTIEQVWKDYLWPEEGQKTKDGLEFPYFRCMYTGKIGSVMVDGKHPDRLSIDHYIPKSQGGTNEMDNAKLVLRKVNDMKGAMLFDEFVEMCQGVVDYNANM